MIARLALADLVATKVVVVALRGTDRTLRHFETAGAAGVLFLSRHDSGTKTTDRCVFMRYQSSSRIGANNATVALLSGSAGLALRSKRFFRGFETLLIPIDLTLGPALIGLLRYAHRQLELQGLTSINGIAVPVLVLRNRRFADRLRTRIYGPASAGPLGVLRAIVDVDAVLLRWVNSVQKGESLSDVDLLATPAAADIIEERFSKDVCTFPIDLYSSDGSNRRTFKSVPYFPPKMADKILASTMICDGGFKAPSLKWQYLSFAFHLMFHKSQLLTGPDLSNPSPKAAAYIRELWRLADAVGAPRPMTLAEIETLLREEDIFPEFDTIGFYSEKNRFLSSYFDSARASVAPGLAVFLVRDFGQPASVIADVRASLTSSGMEILAEVELDSTRDASAIARIRGGNWLDRHAPGGCAMPSHAFVCFDPAPIPLAGREKRMYPRADNRKVLVKRTMRDAISNRHGQKMNAVHASDNSVEAKAYIEALGLGEQPRIAEVLARLSR